MLSLSTINRSHHENNFKDFPTRRKIPKNSESNPESNPPGGDPLQRKEKKTPKNGATYSH